MKNKKIFSIVIGSIILIAAIIIGIITYLNSDGVKLSKQLDLGAKYLTEANYEEAILAFEQAIAIDPMSVDAYLGMADAFIAMEDYESASSTLEKGYNTTGSEVLKEKLNEVNDTIAKIEEEERRRKEEEEARKRAAAKIDFVSIYSSQKFNGYSLWDITFSEAQNSMEQIASTVSGSYTDESGNIYLGETNYSSFNNHLLNPMYNYDETAWKPSEDWSLTLLDQNIYLWVSKNISNNSNGEYRLNQFINIYSTSEDSYYTEFGDLGLNSQLISYLGSDIETTLESIYPGLSDCIDKNNASPKQLYDDWKYYTETHDQEWSFHLQDYRYFDENIIDPLEDSSKEINFTFNAQNKITGIYIQISQNIDNGELKCFSPENAHQSETWIDDLSAKLLADDYQSVLEILKNKDDLKQKCLPYEITEWALWNYETAYLLPTSDGTVVGIIIYEHASSGYNAHAFISYTDRYGFSHTQAGDHMVSFENNTWSYLKGQHVYYGDGREPHDLLDPYPDGIYSVWHV